ncbi:hypothetical protein AXF42_Ash012069 [Apostasia shenzhenica]|uniref:Uncharacterized protein n=1 Tax=Apostasia shenzhenica TaxID=1088818 RepID=A0A2I0AJQ6_9ASPA|nr:hypothetical protein AXF42_Ash012069 [Apostasia shenzhenica]
MASNIDHYLVLLLLFTFTATATASSRPLPAASRPWTDLLNVDFGSRGLAEAMCREAIFRYMSSNQWRDPSIIVLILVEVTVAFKRDSPNSHEYIFAFFANALRRDRLDGPPSRVYMCLRFTMPFVFRVGNHVVMGGGGALHSTISDVQVFFTGT